MRRTTTVLIGLVGVAAVTTTLTARPPARVTEEPLGEIGPGVPPGEAAADVSMDGRRVAWRDRQGERWTVRVNGIARGTPHEKVEAVRLSHDGERLAYCAKDGKSWRVFVDDTASAAFDEVGAPHFSADGRHVAFWAKRGKLSVIVLDGTDGPAYAEVGEPSFAPEDGRVVYPAKRRKKWVVVDGSEERGPEQNSIWRGEVRLGGQRSAYGETGGFVLQVPWLRFTPQRAGLVYFAELDDGWAPVVLGRTGPAFRIVSWPVVFGTNEERAAYAGVRASASFTGGEKAKGHVVIDGVAGPAYEGEPTEKAGSGLLKAFAGLPQGVLALGVRPWGLSARRHGVSDPVVSRDHQHVAYGARRGPSDFVVVKDGTPGASFTRITCDPSFSDDGRLVYVAVSGEKLVLVADEKRVAEVPWKGADCTDLHVVGEHAVFVAGDGEGLDRVFIDGRQVGEHAAGSVTHLTTLAQGETLHVAYEVHQQAVRSDLAEQFRRLERVLDPGAVRPATASPLFVVLDGAAGPVFDEVVTPTLLMSSEGGLTYVARKGRQFVRVTQLPES